MVCRRSAALTRGTMHVTFTYTLGTLPAVSSSSVHWGTGATFGAVDRCFGDTHLALGAVLVLVLR